MEKIKKMKPIIYGFTVGFSTWMIGEAAINELIAQPTSEAFWQIALVAVSAFLAVGTAETIRGYQEEDDA